jgi:hypothetical protein
MKRWDKMHEDVGFAVWQDMNNAQFDAMMAFKHGDKDCLLKARAKLETAIGRINAALAYGQAAQ